MRSASPLSVADADAIVLQASERSDDGEPAPSQPTALLELMAALARLDDPTPSLVGKILAHAPLLTQPVKLPAGTARSDFEGSHAYRHPLCEAVRWGSSIVFFAVCGMVHPLATREHRHCDANLLALACAHRRSEHLVRRLVSMPPFDELDINAAVRLSGSERGCGSPERFEPNSPLSPSSRSPPRLPTTESLTPLLIAAHHGCAAAFEELLAAGSDPLLTSSLGAGVLVELVDGMTLDPYDQPRYAGTKWADNGEAARRIVLVTLAAGADVDARTTKAFPVHTMNPSEGTNALLRAAFGGNAELFDLLVESGAALYSTDHSGKTVLMYAFSGYGDIAFAKHVLGMIADVDEKDHKGLTALNHVFLRMAREGDDVGDGDAVTRAGQRAPGDGQRRLDLLLRAGADLSACDVAGETLLIWLARQSVPIEVSLVATMLEHAPRGWLHAQDTHRRTAIAYFACPMEGQIFVQREPRHAVIVEMILDAFAPLRRKGARLTGYADLAVLNDHDALGQTAVLRAMMGGFDTIVDVLLRRGANVSTSEVERYLLHSAPPRAESLVQDWYAANPLCDRSGCLAAVLRAPSCAAPVREWLRTRPDLRCSLHESVRPAIVEMLKTAREENWTRAHQWPISPPHDRAGLLALLLTWNRLAATKSCVHRVRFGTSAIDTCTIVMSFTRRDWFLYDGDEIEGRLRRLMTRQRSQSSALERQLAAQQMQLRKLRRTVAAEREARLRLESVVAALAARVG